MLMSLVADTRNISPSLFNTTWLGTDLAYAAFCLILAYEVITKSHEIANSLGLSDLAIVNGLPQKQASILSTLEPVSNLLMD